MTTLIAIATLLILAATIVGFLYYFTYPGVLASVTPYTSLLLRIIFIGAVLGSLYYSNILGFAPCVLCWYQRIFIVGIAFLSLTASLGKNRLLQNQVLLFSAIGAAISIFHNILIWFPTGISVCGTSGVSCTILYVNTFGFVTIPLMSLSVLLFGLLLALIAKRFPHA